MTKLNDTQLMILSGASKRRDFSLYPLPKSVKTGQGPKLLKKLLSLKMIEEVEAVGDAPVWRIHEDGYNLTLILADDGFRALGVERRAVKASKQKQLANKTSSAPKPAAATARRANSKQAAMIALLRRAKGVTIDELAEATGWERHSVYGSMSGVLRKKLGLTIASGAGKQGRIYRIVDSAQ